MRIAVHVGSGRVTGASRILIELANGFAAHGHSVCLLAHDRPPVWAAALAPGVAVRPLGRVSRHMGVAFCLARAPRRIGPLAGLRPHGSFARAPALARYLGRQWPDALLVSQDVAPEAQLARLAAGSASRLVIRVNTCLDAYFAERPRYARKNERVFAWSLAAADALVFLTDAERRKRGERHGPGPAAWTIPNPLPLTLRDPVPTAPPHPWLTDDRTPTVITVARFEPQKDLTTLLRAVARLRCRRPVRLLLLGDGSQRSALEALARELGIADAVSMPGTVERPWTWIAHAAVFVLSSRWEGFANALLESLAVGCPVVSTNCPHSPAEILDGGRYGRLVPVADPDAMADAIAAVLDGDRPEPALLRKRARSFDFDAITARYLAVLGGRSPGDDPAREAISSAAISPTGSQNSSQTTDRLCSSRSSRKA